MTEAAGRIERCFDALRAQDRAAFVAFITAGDPNPEQSQQVLNGLPAAGADIIELGMPFSDPMADGPSIQASSQRALKAGQTLRGTLDMVKAFRENDAETPIVLMGYYNPIYHYGVDRFLTEAVDAGVDGLIIVDLPPEEDAELCEPAIAAGIRFIRLLTPTTDDARLDTVLQNTSGFLYYVSVAGITGAAMGAQQAIETARQRIAEKSALPVVVGFGIKTPDHAASVGQVADGVVVGSAIVDQIAGAVDESGAITDADIGHVLGFVGSLADGVRSARQRGAA